VILRHAFIPLDNARLAHLCGSMDEHLRDIESALGVAITRRNESFRIEGPKPAAERAVLLLQGLYDRARKAIPAETFQLALVEATAPAGRARPGRSDDGGGEEIVLRTRRADLAGRTPNQHQ
jgi:phosphate starvation-inducible PhoH-like protein